MSAETVRPYTHAQRLQLVRGEEVPIIHQCTHCGTRIDINAGTALLVPSQDRTGRLSIALLCGRECEQEFLK